MKFYFVYENNQIDHIAGPLYRIYETVIELTEKEEHGSGILGVIDDKGKLRATLAIHRYNQKYRTQLFNFIRKYKALEALEKLSQELQLSQSKK